MIPNPREFEQLAEIRVAEWNERIEAQQKRRESLPSSAGHRPPRTIRRALQALRIVRGRTLRR